MRHLLWIIALLIGFALGYAVKTTTAKNTITLTVRTNQAILVHPKTGDTIKWEDEVTGHPSRVLFDEQPPPCSETVDPDKMLPQCTINVTSGVYGYSCDKNACRDPGVGVGPEVIELAARFSVPARTMSLPSPDTPVVSCDASNNAYASNITATAGNMLEWAPGKGSPGTGWTITPPAGVCSQGDSPFPRAGVCTVQITTPGTTQYQYQVAGTACTGNKKATANLTIQNPQAAPTPPTPASKKGQ